MEAYRGDGKGGIAKLLLPTVYTELQSRLAGVHSIMRVKYAQAGLCGWVVQAPLLTLYLPSPAKWWCTLRLRGQIHTFLISPLPVCVLCSSTYHSQRLSKPLNAQALTSKKTEMTSFTWSALLQNVISGTKRRQKGFQSCRTPFQHSKDDFGWSTKVVTSILPVEPQFSANSIPY